MKKGILFFVISLGLGLASLHAQITVRESNVVEKPIFKPKQFDSLTNIVEQRYPTDYKKYIGYKLYYSPKSKKYKSESDGNKKEDMMIDFLFSIDTIQFKKTGKIPFEEITVTKVFGDPANLRGAALNQYKERKANYENIDKENTDIYLPYFYHKSTSSTDGEIFGKIGTLPDSVYGKYFTILNIEGKIGLGSKEYKKLEDIEIEQGKEWQLNLRITLRNETNQDVLYWKTSVQSLGSPFFLVPYFEKQREVYLNQKVVLRSANRINTDLQNLVDVNTGEIVNIKYGEVWTCSDVTFVDSKDSYYLKCFYFLKNGNREVKISLAGGLMTDYFMLETEFIKQELENKKKEEQLKKEEQERQKKEQLERIKFKNDCIAKWGAKMGGYIAEGKVVLGMSKEMCIAAWGQPININRTILRGLKTEQWVYGWATYLYFDNGALSVIQN